MATVQRRALFPIPGMAQADNHGLVPLPVFDFNLQTVPDVPLMATSHNNGNGVSSEHNRTITVQQDTQKSLLQAQMALEEADKNLEAMLALHSRFQQTESQAFAPGYEFVTQ